MRSIELFTGAGGLALGTHLAGFNHIAVVERDHDSCATLRLNSRGGLVEWPILEADVTCLNFGAFPPDLDLLAGGAPCQPFSLGGKHAGEADSRNLFPEVIRAVRELSPRAFLLENVKGLTRHAFRPYFDYILEQLRSPTIALRPGEGWRDHMTRLGTVPPRSKQYATWYTPPAVAHQYRVEHRLYNVADFGVPQERHRIFIVGLRDEPAQRWHFPEPTHSLDALLYAQYVDGTYWAEHGLARRQVPERLAARVARLAAKPKPMLSRWRTVRDAIGELPEPRVGKHDSTYDNHVGIPAARVYKGHTGSPWDWPAKAIKAGDHGNPGGENMLRRDDGSVRYFTVRELARLQTFPDNWRFASSWTESRRQLGNAVPVAMAEVMGRAVRQALARSEFAAMVLTEVGALMSAG